METELQKLSILDLLRKAQVVVEEESFDYVIHCISKNHVDQTPSLRIDKEEGLFHCFSCGYAGNLEKLIRDLELEVTPEFLEDLRYQELARRLKALKEIDEDFHTYNVEPVTGLPISKDYRGVSKELLGDLKVCRNMSLGRLVFPIKVNGMIQGYTMRALLGQKPKYLHSHGIKFSDLLYPYDYVKNKGTKGKPLFVTEGPFDALRLIELGYNALCMFGVDSWSPYKTSLLLTLAPSCVIILLDNDKAGFKGMWKLAGKLHKYLKTFVPSNYREVSFTDPGEITKEQLENLKYKLMR